MVVLEKVVGSIDGVQADQHQRKIVATNPVVQPEEVEQRRLYVQGPTKKRGREKANNPTASHVLDAVLTTVAKVADPILLETPGRSPAIPISIEESHRHPRRNQREGKAKPAKSARADQTRRVWEGEPGQLVANPPFPKRRVMEHKRKTSALELPPNQLRNLSCGSIGMGLKSGVHNPGNRDALVQSPRLGVLKTKEESAVVPPIEEPKSARALSHRHSISR